MDKIVVLELKGNLEQGFYVTLQIVQPGGKLGSTMDGYLPASPALLQDLTQWQADYRRLSTPARSIKPYKVKVDGKIHPLDVCVESAQQLVHQFQRWLRADSFREVEMHLHQVLMPTDAVQVLIRTTNCEAQALPWQLWDFIEHYSHAEVALSGVSSTPDQTEKCVIPEDESLVKILAVLGDRHNIDIESDRQTLSQLPGSYVEFLVEPTHQQLNDTLYEQRWDILFFAGHSDTEAEGQGILRLNAKDHLTIDEVRYAVRRAIANGLKLAIFNSCNGLGLAHALIKLQLPYMIVMREAVPDRVAQQFLKYFLRTFAGGQSFHRAEREARERLQGMEKEYPCASWLPIIYQHPIAPPLQWTHLRESESDFSKTSTFSWQNGIDADLNPEVAPEAQPKSISVLGKLGIACVCGLLASGLVIGGRSLGLLQRWELKAYDHLMRMRPGQDSPDDRILVVAVSEEDIQYQRSQGMEMEGSLSDDALLMLLQKISPYEPSAVGLDIIHDFPFSLDLQTQVTDQKLIAICRARNTTSHLAGIAPPTEDFLESQLGFSNIPLDPDNVIRRQFLGMTSDEICPSEQSFSFRVTQSYLARKFGISMEWFSSTAGRRQRLRLGSQIFPPLGTMAGGYALSPDNAGGYQILVNYRSLNPEQINLREIISGSLDSQLKELVSDRIILIGVVKPQVDIHLTPYSKAVTSESMHGVFVHAHMISTVISAALGERPLLKWWPEWAEISWVVSWSVILALVAMAWRSPHLRIMSTLAGGIILWGMCLFLLVQGWWVPLIPPALASGLAVAFIVSMYRIRKRISHERH